MILVVVATGTLGGMIARRLLAQGRDVRILVRPGSNFQPLAAAGAQPVTGDLKDPASLGAATEGVAAIITTANSAARGGDDTAESVDLIGNRNLIDAAKQAGVGHFIYTSALGVDPDSPNPLFRAKGQTEVALRTSGVPFTILSPNLLMDLWLPMIVGAPALAGQPVTIVGEGTRKHSMVATADVAAIATATLDHPAAKNVQVTIGGPDPISWRDAAAAYERTLGRPVAIRSVAPGTPIPGLPDLIVALLASTDTYDSPIEMSDTCRTFDVTLTPMATVVQQHVAAAQR